MRVNLKERRNAKNLTQEEIAKLVGISRTTYTNIERGLKNPSFKVAQKIKRVLRTTDDNIFFNSDVA